MEAVHGLGQGLQLGESEMGLHLSDYAAYILTPVYGTLVVAEGDEAGLPADDAAYIVAGMLIPYACFVVALIYGT